MWQSPAQERPLSTPPPPRLQRVGWTERCGQIGAAASGVFLPNQKPNRLRTLLSHRGTRSVPVVCQPDHRPTWCRTAAGSCLLLQSLHNRGARRSLWALAAETGATTMARHRWAPPPPASVPPRLFLLQLFIFLGEGQLGRRLGRRHGCSVAVATVRASAPPSLPHTRPPGRTTGRGRLLLLSRSAIALGRPGLGHGRTTAHPSLPRRRRRLAADPTQT